MELQEFVKITLVQIINGVKEAQETTKNSHSVINPHVKFSSQNIKWVYVGMRDTHFPVQEIEFDVAVQTETKSEAGATVGIVIADIGLGAKGKVHDSQQAVNRIKFSIPIVFPSNDKGNGYIP